MNPNGEPRKLLPSLDVDYVDSFFNEIDNVSLTREEEILLLQKIAREKITIKEEPIEHEACKENHEPLTNDSISKNSYSSQRNQKMRQCRSRWNLEAMISK